MIVVPGKSDSVATLVHSPKKIWTCYAHSQCSQTEVQFFLNAETIVFDTMLLLLPPPPLQLCGVTAPQPCVRRMATSARPMEPAWPPLPSSMAKSSTSVPASHGTTLSPPDSRSTAAVPRACWTSTAATRTTATALTSKYPQVRTQHIQHDQLHVLMISPWLWHLSFLLVLCVSVVQAEAKYVIQKSICLHGVYLLLKYPDWAKPRQEHAITCTVYTAKLLVLRRSFCTLLT